MLKNKAGFIVSLKMLFMILLVTFIIAIPVALTIFYKSERNAMLDIASRVDEAAYRYYIENIGTSTVLDLEKDMDKIGLTGIKPNGGIIKIDSIGNVSFAIYNEYWCVIKKDSNSRYKISVYVQNACKLPNES